MIIQSLVGMPIPDNPDENDDDVDALISLSIEEEIEESKNISAGVDTTYYLCPKV